MNTNSNNTSRGIIALFIAIFTLAPLSNVNAQSSDDEFGVWATFEASKKINKKLKLDFEAELRTLEGVANMERVSLGAGASYKLTKWLKASAGYIFMYKHTLDEIKYKWEDQFEVPGYGTYCDYNIDHAYWTERHRFHVTLTGEYKIGRVELSLRERVQYTRTNSATTDETKYRWQQNFDEEYNEIEPTLIEKETESDFKEAKHNTTLRSRLTAKWDIENCKITPFASVELYTRLDDWKGFDRLRYRLGADYKIDKKNKVSLYYLFQHDNNEEKTKGHAIGIGYSLDL